MAAILNTPYRTVPRNIHGGNYWPSETQFANTIGLQIWAEVWGNSYDFSYITGQIDLAVSVGWNCFRIIGDAFAVHNGDISLATYLTRQGAVAGYCEAKGLYYYVTGSSQNNIDGGMSASDISAVVAPLAQRMQYARNVIGMDVIQEAHLAGGSPETILSTVLTTVQAAAPNLSLTGSYAVGSGTWGGPYGSGTTNKFGHFDGHCYYDPTNSLDANAMVTLAAGRPCLLGEFGQNQAAGNPAIASRYDTVRAVVERSDFWGANQWAIREAHNDAGAGGAQDWGAWTYTGTARSIPLNNFAAFSMAGIKARIPRVRCGRAA